MTTPRHKGSQQNTLPELRTCLLRNTQLNSSDIGIAKISWLSLNALRGKFPLWSHTIFFVEVTKGAESGSSYLISVD